MVQNHIQMQPRPVIVGPINVIDASYVLVNATLYKAHTPLQVLDLCFKCYFALAAGYPSEAHAVWLFIQKSVYAINTVHDKSLPPAVTSLLGASNLDSAIYKVVNLDG